MEKAKAFGWFCEDSEDWLKRRQLWINASQGVMPPDYELNFQMESRAGRECIMAEFSHWGKMTLTDDCFWPCSVLRVVKSFHQG